MKKCYYCNGKTVTYKRDADMKVTVVCAGCGTEVKTPHMTEDSARGYWNMKMAELEKKKKEAAVE